MSQYQYYAFQAMDRPLTQKQMEELRRYSSRAQITPSSFVNVYNYGNFRGDPVRLVEEYFDAFLYLTNWGTRWLMLRVPTRLLAPKTRTVYATGDALCCHEHGDHVIFSFRSESEDYEWEEGEGWLDALAPIRTELMRGDHRALYLGWLLGVQAGEVDDDACEPPVPPVLGALDAPLTRLADFLRIDTDLIAAGAEQSTSRANRSLSKRTIVDWISRLPEATKDTLLAKLIGDDDPHLIAELQQQVLHAARGGAPKASAPRRTAAQLLERAQVLGEARRNKEAAARAEEEATRQREAAARRQKYLESLQGQEDALWHQVHQLIETRQPKRYDEAISLLRDLRDIALIQGDASAFMGRMAALNAAHARKTKLVERFRKAGLMG